MRAVCGSCWQNCCSTFGPFLCSWSWDSDLACHVLRVGCSCHVLGGLGPDSTPLCCRFGHWCVVLQTYKSFWGSNDMFVFTLQPIFNRYVYPSNALSLPLPCRFLAASLPLPCRFLAASPKTACGSRVLVKAEYLRRHHTVD